MNSYLFDFLEFGKFNYLLITISGFSLTAVFAESCGISYVLPVSQCDLNLTTHQKGILGAVSLFGIICSSYIWGFLADTKGRQYVMRPTLLIAFVFSVLSSLTNSFTLFAILRFFVGFL